MLARGLILSTLKMTWQLLRLLAVSLIVLWGWLFFTMIFEFAASPPAVRGFYDPYTCGKISGYVLRYPKAYVKFWPEYEGKSSWEAGFIHNKKGCGANLTSLTMMMSWPELKPVGFSVGDSSEFKELTMTIRPLLPIFRGMPKVLDTSLKLATPEQMSRKEYRGDLGLYHVRAYGPTWEDSYSDFYWSERNGAVEHVIYCLWLPVQNKNYRCVARFLIPELEAFAEVKFPSEDLDLWREFLVASVRFLNDGLIGSE